MDRGDKPRHKKSVKILAYSVIVIITIMLCATMYFKTKNEKIDAEEKGYVQQISTKTISKVCRDVESPFWAIDCNTALVQAYKYYVKKYGATEKHTSIGFHGLHVFKDKAYYVFGFYNKTTDEPICIIVDAVNYRKIREDRNECIK